MRARAPVSSDPHEPKPTDRQERIPGFEQERFSRLSVALIGAGGLGGEIGEGLVRKGIGCLKIFDPDRVELSNLNRQRFFEKDLGRNKAQALCENLVPEAIRETEFWGYPMTFQEAVARGAFDEATIQVAVCAVDNNRTRIFASQHFRRLRVPLVILGVSADGTHGYVFVQEGREDAACFGCVFPDLVADGREPCPNTPAIKDILKTVAGATLYAVDSLVMEGRKRRWSYRQIFLDGSVPDRCHLVDRAKDCDLCGPAAVASRLA